MMMTFAVICVILGILGHMTKTAAQHPNTSAKVAKGAWHILRKL